MVANYGRGGGAAKWEGGGHVKYYPYKKGGGGGTSFSHAEGGPKTFWGSFYAVALAILKGGITSFHSLKVGGVKSFTLS